MSDEEYIPDRLRALGYSESAKEVERMITELAKLRARLDNYVNTIGRENVQLEASNERVRAARIIVDEQAGDDGLWFIAETCAEAYVQQALRRLHAAIEGKTPEQCAIETIAALTHEQEGK